MSWGAPSGLLRCWFSVGAVVCRLFWRMALSSWDPVCDVKRVSNLSWSFSIPHLTESDDSLHLRIAPARTEVAEPFSWRPAGKNRANMTSHSLWLRQLGWLAGSAAWRLWSQVGTSPPMQYGQAFSNCRLNLQCHLMFLWISEFLCWFGTGSSFQRHLIARYSKIDLFYPLIVRLMQLSLGLFGYEWQASMSKCSWLINLRFWLRPALQRKPWESCIIVAPIYKLVPMSSGF